MIGPDPRPLRDAGLSTVAVPYGRKFPPPQNWERWSFEWPTDAEIAEQFADGQRHNIAVLGGPASGGIDAVGEPLSAGLVVLVFNNRRLLDAWNVHRDLAHWTWCCESHRGLHVYIRLTDRLPERTVYFNGGPSFPSVLEVRTSRAYVVGAGSLHPAGTTYTWHEPRPPRIAELDFDTFGDWFREHRLRAAEDGWHLRVGTTLQQPGTPTERANPNVPRVLPERIQGPRSDSAGERHFVLVSLAGTLRRRGLDATEIEACLLEVNRARCEPPCAERDIKRIANSVARYDPNQVDDYDGVVTGG